MTQPLSSIFLVTTEAHEGQEDEYNGWYTNVHCHDIMRLEGSVAVQRFKLSRYQLRYNAKYHGKPLPWLCIYELNDTQQNMDDHVEKCFTNEMPISLALKTDTSEDFYYVPVIPGKTAVQTYNARGGDILTIRANARQGAEAEFSKWYREDYQPRLLKLIGFVDGELYRAADIQLVDAMPSYEFSAVYHIADPMVAVESLDSHLVQSGTVLDCPYVEPNSIGIACYQTITNRLTAEQARNLPPEQQKLEDEFRARMGDRVHKGEAPDGLQIKRT